MAELVITDNRDQSEKKAPLFRAITRIGGGEDHDIIVAGAPRDAAQIVRSGDDFTVAGLDAEVVVNGKKEKQKRLAHGDRIVIGSSELRFITRDDAVVATTPAPSSASREQEIALRAYEKLNQ